MAWLRNGMVVRGLAISPTAFFADDGSEHKLDGFTDPERQARTPRAQPCPACASRSTDMLYDTIIRIFQFERSPDLQRDAFS